MNSALIPVILAALLVGVGVYLLLERSLSRIVIGVAMVGNGINVLFLAAGGPPGLRSRAFACWRSAPAPASPRQWCRPGW